MIPDWLDKRRGRGKSFPPLPIPSRNLGEVDPNPLLRDVAFNRHSMNDGEHVSPTDNGIVQVGADGIEVVMIQGLDVEKFRKTTTAATRATIGLDLTQTLPGDWEPCAPYRAWHMQHEPGLTGDTSDMDLSCEHEDHRARGVVGDFPVYEGKVPYQDWEEMLKGGLQTALETQTIVFAVKGTSRTCTHQLVRSRRAAFHQQSQRAGYMGDAPELRMPESIWRNERARLAFLVAAKESWRAYRIACEEDIAYQDARFALLEGTTNFILLEYSLREFMNLYAYRGCSMFQWEIVHVMRECRSLLVDEYPWLDPYIKISCEKTGPAVTNIGDGSPGQDRTVPHHCTFQGWEDVEGQCDFPWAKQEARTFKPAFHRITRKAAE